MSRRLQQAPASPFKANDAGTLEPSQLLDNLKFLYLLTLASQRIVQLGGGLRAGSEGEDVRH